MLGSLLHEMEFAQQVGDRVGLWIRVGFICASRLIIPQEYSGLSVRVPGERTVRSLSQRL